MSSVRVFISTIVSSIMLSACGSVRSSTTPVKTAVYAPAEVVAPFVPSGKAADANATSLTLEQLLIYADAHAPVVLSARSQAGSVAARRVGADLTFPTNPQVSVGAGGRTIDGQTGFEFEIAVQQKLEIAGEQDGRRSVAQDQLLTAKSTVNEVRWQVHVEVHRLFGKILLARERRAQAERFVEFSQLLRNIVARQIEAGESSPLVLMIANADLAQTQGAVIEAHRLRDSFQIRLAALIGWPGVLPRIEGTLPSVRRAPKEATLLTKMAAHHPTLRTRELAVRAQKSQVDLATREGWPKPTLGLSYSRESAVGPGADAHIWLFNLALPIPIWRSNQGGKAKAAAQVLVADRVRDETAVRLRSQLQQAVIAMNAATERVALYETGVVPKLEKNLSLLQRAYELGEVDIHQVSQTRERLLNATAQSLDARVTYYKTAATLEGLVGTELWP